MICDDVMPTWVIPVIFFFFMYSQRELTLVCCIYHCILADMQYKLTP